MNRIGLDNELVGRLNDAISDSQRTISQLGAVTSKIENAITRRGRALLEEGTIVDFERDRERDKSALSMVISTIRYWIPRLSLGDRAKNTDILANFGSLSPALVLLNRPRPIAPEILRLGQSWRPRARPASQHLRHPLWARIGLCPSCRRLFPRRSLFQTHLRCLYRLDYPYDQRILLPLRLRLRALLQRPLLLDSSISVSAGLFSGHLLTFESFSCLRMFVLIRVKCKC